MFDFQPSFLWIYLVTTEEGIENEKGSPKTLSEMETSGYNLTPYITYPPNYSSASTQSSVVSYYFNFSNIKEEYNYINFGWQLIRYGSPYQYRYYNKGKFLDNTLYWYSYGERREKNNNSTVEEIDGASLYQLNEKDNINNKKYKYYWIAL